MFVEPTSKIPSQTYIPRNKWNEWEQIAKWCGVGWSVFEQSLIDRFGNRFRLNYEDGSIEVN